jgi:hypothetical protein
MQFSIQKPQTLSGKPTAITYMDDVMLLSLHEEAIDARVSKDFIMLIESELTKRNIRF